LDVAYVCSGFQVFSGVFVSVSYDFRCMLQVLHLDISKVVRVLHMLQCDPPTVAVGGGARGQAARRRCVGSGGAQTPWATGRAQTPRRVGRYAQCKCRNWV
jgi:hypothetical protein